jgi:hypothetical protein
MAQVPVDAAPRQPREVRGDAVAEGVAERLRAQVGAPVVGDGVLLSGVARGGDVPLARRRS